MKEKFPFMAVLKTALLAGTLDITAAFINTYLRSGSTPEIVLQFIASGVLGDRSFEQGIFTALLGLIFHYFIAFSWTVIFFLIYPELKLSSSSKIFSGLIYGIIIWLIMNLIVVPLSNTPQFSPGVIQNIIGLAFIMFLVVLPISLMFHKSKHTIKPAQAN